MSKDVQAPGLRKAGDAHLHPSTPQGGVEEPSLLRRGASTADSVGSPDRDKPVGLEVTIAKSLRKSIRAEAKRRGVSVDEIVAEALRTRTMR